MIQQEVGIVPLLQSFYKASKIKFDDEKSGFKAKAQQAVVRLQVSAVFSVRHSESIAMTCDLFSYTSNT